MTEEKEATALHNKDFTILTIQMGYLNESQKRIEDLIKEFRNDFKAQLETVRDEVTLVDQKHERNYRSLSNDMNNENKLNLAFRVKVMTYATVGSILGAGVWQIAILLIQKNV